MSLKTICSSCGIILLVMVARTEGADFKQFATQLLAETNLARTDPNRYIANLRELRRHFEGKFYRMPGSGATIVSNEGVAAVDEAIGFLSHQRPVSPLTWSQGLADAAADLVREQGQTGETGHKGRSGDMQGRIERHGAWLKHIAENIGYGPDTARLMIMELIIDDGVPDRGHRKNIFNRSFTVAGAACGPHPRFRSMCVMDFAGRFYSRGKH